MSDLTSLLNKPAGEAPKPKARPAGEYLYTISKYEFGKSSQKKTDYVELTCIPTQPGGDVDMAEYSALTPEQQRKEQRLTFYLTESALFMLDGFLEKVGLPISGRSYNQVLGGIVGTSFWGMTAKKLVEPKPGEAPPAEPRFFNEITDYRTAA